jgi:hypothetical protein
MPTVSVTPPSSASAVRARRHRADAPVRVGLGQDPRDLVLSRPSKLVACPRERPQALHRDQALGALEHGFGDASVEPELLRGRG